MNKKRALIQSFGHLMPKGLAWFSLEDPIHVPSVLVVFNIGPDIFLKRAINLKSALAELVSNRTAVISSAPLKKLCFFFDKHSTSDSWVVANCCCKISAATTNKYGDSGLLV